MSWRATGFIKELDHAGNGDPLTMSQKLVLMILADAYLDETRRAIADVPKLARWLGCGERQAIRLVRILEASNTIRVIRHRLNGRPIKGLANEYQIVGLDGVTVSGDMGGMPICHSNAANSGDIVDLNRVTLPSKKGDSQVIPTKELSTKRLSTRTARAPQERAAPPPTDPAIPAQERDQELKRLGLGYASPRLKKEVPS